MKPKSGSSQSFINSKAEKYFIFSAGFVVFAFIGLVVLSEILAPDLDDKGCPVEGVSKHTIVMIDKTDRYTKGVTDAIRQQLNDVAKALSVGELLSIYTIDDEPIYGRRPVFQECMPDVKADILLSFRKASNSVEKEYLEKFQVPLDTLLVELLENEEYNKSPIFENMVDVLSFRDFGPEVKRRRLVIVSDLLQNTGSATIYGASKKKMVSDLKAYDFTGLEHVKVELIYIPRAGFKKSQRDMLDSVIPKALTGVDYKVTSLF